MNHLLQSNYPRLQSNAYQCPRCQSHQVVWIERSKPAKLARFILRGGIFIASAWTIAAFLLYLVGHVDVDSSETATNFYLSTFVCAPSVAALSAVISVLLGLLPGPNKDQFQCEQCGSDWRSV